MTLTTVCREGETYGWQKGISQEMSSTDRCLQTGKREGKKAVAQ